MLTNLPMSVFIARVASVLLMLAVLPPDVAAADGVARRVEDDLGNSVVLAQPARRIISLSPHITEILFAVGAGPAIVGTVEYSDYPAAAQTIPRIGNFAAFNIEAILALQPDLIIAWHSGNPPAPVATLRRLGLPVFFSEPRALDDVAGNLEKFGSLAGTGAVAQGAAQDLRRELRELRAAHAQREPVTVFYQIWRQPLMTINREHLINQAIDLCGGRNVFADLPVLDPVINTEAVLAADPQLIVGGGVAAVFPQWQQDWQRFPQLQAIQRGQLYEMPPDLLQRHTPRIVQGIRTLCAFIDAARNEAARPDTGRQQ